MSKGTVSAAMGMLQMLIFTVGIELSKHAYELGGNGLFSLFNLLGGVLWLGLIIYFLKDKKRRQFAAGVIRSKPGCPKAIRGFIRRTALRDSMPLSRGCIIRASSLLCGA